MCQRNSFSACTVNSSCQAAEAELKGASAAQAEFDTAASPESCGKPAAALSARGTGTGWPAKQQPGAGRKAFSKQGPETSAVAGAGGAKKKLVIKLKKKP